jgi:hypothetical protein
VLAVVRLATRITQPLLVCWFRLSNLYYDVEGSFTSEHLGSKNLDG